MTLLASRRDDSLKAKAKPKRAEEAPSEARRRADKRGPKAERADRAPGEASAVLMWRSLSVL